MISRKGAQLLNRLIRWSKTELISRPSYHLCKEVIERTETFSDQIADRVYTLFTLFFPHTQDQLDDLDALLSEHRLDLALELRTRRRDFNTLVNMIKDLEIEDLAVTKAFLKFTDEDTVRIFSLLLFRMIEKKRPELTELITDRLTPEFRLL